MKDQFSRFRDIVWVLSLGMQGGLMLSLPVLGGLALGYWLDMRYDTLPWITLGLMLTGTIIGPILLYRFMKTVVKERMTKEKNQNQNEENLELWGN
ncbi:MAG: AtpZ/AtpI family protein [Anaerolineales bacterium]